MKQPGGRLSWAAGPIFPAYLNGPWKENKYPTCSQSVWSDRTVVPFGQCEDNDTVNNFLRTLALRGMKLLGADMRSPVHWQTDGILLGLFDRTMISFVEHVYSLSSGLNLKAWPSL